MRLIATLFTAAAVIAAVPAVAQDRVTEADYLRAARCQGLAHAAQLGRTDTAAIDAFMKAQGERRSAELRQRARSEGQTAYREAQSAGARTRLLAERTERCAAWMGSAQVASMGSSGAQ